jgi:hypothetical protein
MHSNCTPGGVPAGGSTNALTIDHVHTGTACFADLRDHAIRLMKRRGRHCLGGGCDGQSKCNSDQPDHCHLPYDPSKKDFLEEERAVPPIAFSVYSFRRAVRRKSRMIFSLSRAPMATDQEIMGRSVLAIRQVNVRFGSLADIASRPRHVRYSPQSGHSSARVARPLSAISRHSSR